MTRSLFAGVVILVLSSTNSLSESIKLAVTTSFHNSGLSDVLLPAIKRDINLDVKLLVVGTGQALRLGRAGDVDAILVHSRKAEDTFIKQGFGFHRREIMYNDFVFIGPDEDPAKISKAISAVSALRNIAEAKVPFVSRGDDSGTHKMELSLWRKAELDVHSFGAWYRAVGAGMGAALNTASGMNAYIMSDRGSWLKFGNKGNLSLLYSGDNILFNQYAFLPINSELHKHVKADLVTKLENWFTGDHAKSLINNYKVNGEKLFVFNAR